MGLTTNGECELCGTYGRVQAALVAWLVPVGQPFANVNRCEDRAGCQERVLARGDDWPVIEPNQAADGSRKEASR